LKTWKESRYITVSLSVDMGKEHNTQKWKRLRKAYKSRNYFCEIWLSLGKSVKADHVDHMIRIEEGGAVFSKENLMAVSEFWHNAKSRQEQLCGSLNIPYFDTPDGKVPQDREDIIRFMKELKKQDLQDYLDGYRTF
jgi:5-methylcytosine-specific restriction endonuclease McrA